MNPTYCIPVNLPTPVSTNRTQAPTERRVAPSFASTPAATPAPLWSKPDLSRAS